MRMFKEGKKVKIRKDGNIKYHGMKGKVIKIDEDSVNGIKRLLVEGVGLRGAGRVGADGRTELIPNSRYFYDYMLDEEVE